MALWTDIIEPAEATGILRAELQLREQAKGTLTPWLPNVEVDDDHVKFYRGDHGLVDEAYYRAFNAAPEIIGGDGYESALIELPALSNNQPIDERTQKAIRRLPDDRIKKSITDAIRRAAYSIADRNERTRGLVIHTGRASVIQHNFVMNDDFGRDPALSFTAPALWSATSTDRMAQLETWIDLYASKNGGEEPGSIVMSRAAYRALSRGDQFRTVLPGGASRPAERDAVDGLLAANGMPPVFTYDRSTKAGPVLPKEYIYFLPAAADSNDPDGTALGATFWGRTVSADIPEFGILPGEQPGAVVGVYQEPKMPYTVEVMADSITLPVARDANKSMAVKVL